jgi:hypothetical protein
MPKDRFLLGIVLVILLLVAAAFVFALRQPEAVYLPEGTARAVANNYLLALEQSDYARAYSYLSADLPGYPQNVFRFTASFAEPPGGQSWKILAEKPLSADGTAMLVEVEITQFSPEDLFFTTTHGTLEMEWVQDADGWKLVGTTGMYRRKYFPYCWYIKAGCSP